MYHALESFSIKTTYVGAIRRRALQVRRKLNEIKIKLE